MATKKDLVEAYSFSRRRLVTAFVSGAPGGREVEPTRPGRAVVGGLALAVLLVAGGAVLGILKSPQTVDWDEEQFISDKDTGANYLLLQKTDGSGETELRSVLNITSAMLVFGTELSLKRVPADQFERPTGASIGILGAPATPPSPSSLVQTGWTACTGPTPAEEPTGIDLGLSADPAATPAPDLTFVVETEAGDVFVIAQARGDVDRDRAYAYPVPDTDSRERVLSAVAGTSTPVPVPAQWVGLFPSGGRLALETFGITDQRFGAPWPGRGSTPGTDRARIGDLLRTDDAVYLLTDGEGVLELDEFAQALYTDLQFPRGRQPTPIPAFQAPATDVMSSRDLPGAFWPSEVRGEVPPTEQLCALLDAQGREPGVLLGIAPDAAAPDPADPSSAVLDLDDVAVSVDSGRGAFVLSGDFTEGGPASTFLVDDRGVRYPVGPGEAQERLGFGEVEQVEVPDVWVELLRPGVPLTIEAARCPPSPDDNGGCS